MNVFAAVLVPLLLAPPPPPAPPLPTVDPSAMEPAVRAQIEEAQKALDAARARQAAPPELAAAYGRCGEVYALYQLNGPALAAFREAARLAPAEHRWAYLLGALHQLQGEDADAERELTRALSLRAGDGPSLARRGEVRLRLGMTAEARQDFAVLAALPGFAAASAAGLGRVLAAQGDYAGAAKGFEAALAEQPGAGEIRYQLGLAYRRLGRMEEARKAVASPSAGAVRFPDPLIEGLARESVGSRRAAREGTDLLRAGRFAEAAEAMRRALALDPNDDIAWANLGIAQSRLGDPKRAEESYLKAIAVNPASDLALFNLGSLRIHDGRLAEAVEPLEAAARANPSSKPILFNLAKVLGDLGQPARAIPYWDRLVELAPDDLEAHFNRATAFLSVGRATEAAEEYGKVVAGAPGAADPRYGQALALLEAKRDREARVAIEGALEVFPGEPKLTHLLIRVLAGSYDDRVRDGAKALAVAQELARGGGSNPLPEEAMAVSLAELGKFLEAAQHERQAIELAETAAPGLLPRLRRCLEAFERQEPCREPWK